MSNITTSIEEVEKLKCWYCAFLRYLIPLMALFLIVFGTITNYWSSVVCFKLQRTQPTSAFTILGFMFLVCPFNLYKWNLNVFLDLFYKIRQNGVASLSEFNVLETKSLTACRIFYFMQQFGIHSTAWLFSLLLLDQVTKLYFSKLKCHKNIIFMTVTSVVIIFIAFVTNFTILLFAGRTKFSDQEIEEMNKTGKYVTFTCYDSDVFNYEIFNIATDFLTELIPLGVIGLCSILIFLKLRIKSSLANSIDPRSVKRRQKYSISFLIMSAIYLTCTLPSMISFTYYFGVIIGWKNSDIFLSFLDVLHFIFYGMLPTIFFFTNQMFKREIMKIIPGKRSAVGDASTVRTI
jgi:positive regulator of sigma E activity